jgi:hypothetical protein
MLDIWIKHMITIIFWLIETTCHFVVDHLLYSHVIVFTTFRTHYMYYICFLYIKIRNLLCLFVIYFISQHLICSLRKLYAIISSDIFLLPMTTSEYHVDYFSVLGWKIQLKNFKKLLIDSNSCILEFLDQSLTLDSDTNTHRNSFYFISCQSKEL